MTIKTEITSSLQAIITDLDENNGSALQDQINILSAQILNPDRPASLQWLNSQRTSVTEVQDFINLKITVYDSFIKRFEDAPYFKEANCMDMQIAILTKCSLLILHGQKMHMQCDTLLTSIDSQSRTV